MSTPISRRDFLSSLVPSWATRRNLVAGAIGAGVVIAVSVVISVLREVGFLSVLKMSAVGLGLVCVLWVFGWITSVLRSAFKKAPPVVQAFVVVLFQFAGGIAVYTFGAYVYALWQATDDKTEFITTTGFMLAVAFFGEWQKRRANKTPLPTPVERPPSNHSQVPGAADL